MCDSFIWSKISGTCEKANATYIYGDFSENGIKGYIDATKHPGKIF